MYCFYNRFFFISYDIIFYLVKMSDIKVTFKTAINYTFVTMTHEISNFLISPAFSVRVVVIH